MTIMTIMRHTSVALHLFCWQWQQCHSVQLPSTSGQSGPQRLPSPPEPPVIFQSPHVS